MRTKHFTVILGCLVAAFLVAGAAQAQFLNGSFDTPNIQSQPPASWSWNAVSGGYAQNPTSMSGVTPHSAPRMGTVGGGAANTYVQMYQQAAVSGAVSVWVRWDCNDGGTWNDDGRCFYQQMPSGPITYFHTRSCNANGSDPAWVQYNFALAGTYRIGCESRNVADGAVQSYMNLDDVTSGSSTCPPPTITSFGPTTGVTNAADCCRTETFNVVVGGQMPITYNVSFTPPAGGSVTPGGFTGTTSGSFSFTATLCGGPNVPATGHNFGINLNLINCSGQNNFTYVQNYNLRDTTPPTFAAGGGSLFCVWPPNHNWVSTSIGTGPGQVDPTGRAIDNCTVSTSMAYTFALPASDEPANGQGDGDTEVDTGISPDGRTVFIRAERAGGGDGREYEIMVSARDAAGNSSAGSVGSVEVPHDMSEGQNCVNSTQVGDK